MCFRSSDHAHFLPPPNPTLSFSAFLGTLKRFLSLAILFTYQIIIKSLDPLRAKKTFIRKKLGHTMVSAINASTVTLKNWQKEPEENTVNLQILIMAVVYKTDVSKYTKIFQICYENES